MMKSGHNNEEHASVLQNAIKVMVVDNNKALLGYVRDSLKSYSFEVKCVDRVGDALRILTGRGEKYDLLFIGGELEDLDVITFLRLTKNMGIPSMVMHEEAHDDFVNAMIANGALCVVERPLANDVFMRARQFVIKERLKKFGELESDWTTGGKKVTMSNTQRNSNVQLHENGAMFVKVYLKWTKELHSIFLSAAHKLAREGRCSPKNILVEMGVPEITRTQVASHLQKCRRGANNSKFGGSYKGLSKSSRIGSTKGSQDEEEITSPLVALQETISYSSSSNVVKKDDDDLNTQSVIGSSSRKSYGRMPKYWKGV